MKVKETESREIHRLLYQYTEANQHPINTRIQYFAIPLLFLGIVSFLNLIPFPALSFLGVYQGFINWFTLALALLGYYYYTQSPILMWCIIIIFFGMQLIFVQFEHWEKATNVKAWQITLILLILSTLLLGYGKRLEGKKFHLKQELYYILISPLCILGTILKKFKIKY